MDSLRKHSAAGAAAARSSIIDVGLAKTHAKCLPCDIVFAPYQVDNMVFHFPLPPVSKPATVQHSPIDSAIYICSPDHENYSQAEVDQRPEDYRYDQRDESSIPTKIDLPLRISSLQPIGPLPSAYEESCHPTNRSSYFTNFQRQETLNKLEDNLTADPRAPHSSLIDTRPQLAELPRSSQRPARIGPPPTRPAPQRPLREEINPEFQRSSDALRRRAASLRNHNQDQSTRPRSISKAQIVLGLQQPEKSAVEQLFDQAVLEFQQQAPHIAAAAAAETKKPSSSQRNDIAASRWASRTQRKILTEEQTVYTPGSSWRPTAKVHRTHMGGGSSGSHVTISTPALASRLGVAVGASTQLRIEAFYDND